MDIRPTPSISMARRRLRTVLLARWIAIGFALVQVVSYATQPYPGGLREVALGIVAVMAVSAAVFEVAHRRAASAAAVRRLGLVVLIADVLAASGITWVYAFDSVSAIFFVLVLLPIEGAVLFGYGGALWTWAGVAVLYVGREWFGTRYGNPFELESVTFRVGIIGIVALIVGMLVRDLVRQREATASALQEAQQVEESRTRLISMLAHDVRAPIAGTRVAFETLRAGANSLTGQQRQDVLRAGRRQADRALLLARDLLDLARAEAGTLEVEPTVVDLEELVSAVRAVLQVEVELDIDLGDLSVYADRARMEQVVFNLVENAIKYGAEPIELTARHDGDEVELVVRDHGPGVPDEVDLFTPFSHAGEGSVGLGMWIVRQLVQANGGTVAHRDADPGAAFVIRLPAVGADRPQAATTS